ncbi:MAG: GspH/FimT family pseudopilin [Cellvibrionaceae bacterium]
MKRITLGFTLLNLLITLSIVGILLSTGIPGLSTLLANSQANNAYQRLFTLIQFTRIQAVNYQSQVIICPTVNKKTCISNWNQPLMVFVDINDDKTKNANELLLQSFSKMQKDEYINWKASGELHYLRFKPDGSTGNQNGRLTYCLKKGEDTYARQIVMYRTGRARRGSETEALKKC